MTPLYLFLKQYREEVSQIFNQHFSFSKLLVVVLGPFSVEELVSVEDAPSAVFAGFGI